LVRHQLSSDSRDAAADVYRSGELYANFPHSYVAVDDHPVMLQPLEFGLLRYLVQKRNQLVTRQELWREVWNASGAMNSRTIDVHVCRLRRHLGSAANRIQTLVRRGYRFVDTDAARG
jgi:DNA-binding response OmpR family regulator